MVQKDAVSFLFVMAEIRLSPVLSFLSITRDFHQPRVCNFTGLTSVCILGRLVSVFFLYRLTSVFILWRLTAVFVLMIRIFCHGARRNMNSGSWAYPTSRG
jgi:hypothetical protein